MIRNWTQKSFKINSKVDKGEDDLGFYNRPPNDSVDPYVTHKEFHTFSRFYKFIRKLVNDGFENVKKGGVSVIFDFYDKKNTSTKYYLRITSAVSGLNYARSIKDDLDRLDRTKKQRSNLPVIEFPYEEFKFRIILTEEHPTACIVDILPYKWS